MIAQAATRTQAPAAAPPPPYKTAEAAALLGVAQATVERYYAELGGIKLGSRIVIPRAKVDELAGIPAAEPAPPLARVEALLPLLDRDGVLRVLALTARRIAEETRP